LWAAALLAVVAGTPVLAAAILAVILLNAVFAALQELQAERPTEALRECLSLRARVRSGGEEVPVDAATLVPGDLLLLSEGDLLSAAARLVSGAVEVDASPLTGESQPVDRSAERRRRAPLPLESEDLMFSGTLVTAGEAEAVVYALPLQDICGTVALGLRDELYSTILATFLVVVWGWDELVRCT
jgi:magnesium-transporting ATPase (P-type)